VEKKEKKPVHKKWWFWVLAVIIVGSWIVNGNNDSAKNNEDEAKETVAEQKENKNELKDVDLNIEIEVTETIIDDGNVTVKGTTNLIDGAVLAYQIRATEDDAVVENGKWEIVKSIEELDKDDENNSYGDGTELNFFIEFPTFAKQPEHIIEAYGEYGKKIKDGPNLLDDGETKSVSVRVDFDKNGIIDEKEKKEKEFEQAVKEWNESFKEQMLEHYDEYGVTSIQMNPGSDWDVVNVFVPNEFKLLSEEEKRYWVEEIGPLLEADLTDHFKKDHTVHVYFKYEDGTDMATRKMLGGWKIK